MSIFCAITYSVATTNLAEVCKLPVFVEHFIDYNGGFVDFLIEHYDNHKEDGDWDTDQKLPFINPPIVLMIHAQLPEAIFHIEKIKEIYISQKNIFYHEKDFSSFFLSEIFQPPRFC
ncbi:hypothetical protein [Chryseobacterium sp.]|uniref:hypothetical protein n=1 Tax=Chryseobacterium sp. TaxID=1871047 RepID=UPI0025B96365|nr:hypothetical protein [Chryseobacterium sp.]